MQRFMICLILVIATLDVSLAQPPESSKDAQSTYEPKSAPGEGQKFLEKFVGDWSVDKAFYPRGGGEPARVKGVCKQTMIHGGRFLQSDFVFKNGDEQSTGMGLIGFESNTGRFTSIWTDSRQTRMSFRQSQDKFDGKQIILWGKGLGDEKQRYESKTITSLEENGNKIIHRQYSQSADGKDRLVMELILTRRK